MSLVLLFPNSAPGAVALDGTAAGTATATGVLSVSQALVGAATGQAATAAALTVQQALVGAALGAATAAGILSVSGALVEEPSRWKPGRQRLGASEPRWRQWARRGVLFRGR